MRKVLAVFLGLVVVSGGAWLAAGRLPGPVIEITNPVRLVGVSSPLDIAIDARGATVSSVRVEMEQGNQTAAVLTHEGTGTDQKVSADGPGRIRVTHVVGRDNVPGLVSGPARLIVTASRPVLLGLRTVESSVTRDVVVRLERPRVSVVSTHHYVNQGGAEMVVYRASPADVHSGVVVGNIEYPGYPATGITVAGITLTDPALHVAFFALLYDQAPETPIRLFARDEAGNAVRAEFESRVFPKPAKQSRIELTDALFERVVPAILEGTTDVAPQGSLLDKYLVINSELRRKNAETIASFASKTARELLWRGAVFHPFTNSAVESAFADRRTYVYQGKEVDRQVHLGFDLASYANTPIVAANRGVVVFADELGIYGNCVIVDHGFGVQSLYAHLSSMSVTVGTSVEKDQPIGRSGITGLAGGDHLHFTMLINGRMVNPVEWWDAHWIEDRILRKLRQAQ
jgi:murein DD-endopeptidase MepM/ murein hydrolase activator NlpD